MPDNGVWTPWKQEDTKMDAEIREAFARIDNKLDTIIRDASADRERIVGVESASKSAHHRFNDLHVAIRDARAVAEESRGPGAKGWAGIIVAAITAAGAALVAWLKGSPE